jgi:hypothetical protein
MNSAASAEWSAWRKRVEGITYRGGRLGLSLKGWACLAVRDWDLRAERYRSCPRLSLMG